MLHGFFSENVIFPGPKTKGELSDFPLSRDYIKVMALESPG